MLFQKKIDPRCSYCARGANLGDDQVLCIKKGMKSTSDHCRGFRYDPMKRVPPRPVSPDFSKLKGEDFSL